MSTSQPFGAEPIALVPPALPGRTSATQRWSDVSFVHWRVDPADVAPLLPAGTHPDEFDGSSWVGLIGFELSAATLFGSPPVPYFGTFAEINVRLYAVDDSGRRGVVFATLEASRLLAVIGARAAFSLPYRWSRTRLTTDSGDFDYSSRRRAARTAFTVRRTAAVVTADPLAEFLTARWALFVRNRGRTMYLRNTHEQWELFAASVELIDDELVAEAGLPGVSVREPDSVLWSPGVTARFGAGTSLP